MPRSAPHLPRFAGALLVLGAQLVVPGCSSEPLSSCSDTGVVRAPYTRKCLPQSFDPITDAADPNYGRVACQIVSAWTAGSAECACSAPGFAQASAEQRSWASAQLSPSQACESACCEELCFCEFLQHTGDALAACQSRASQGSYEGPPSGWCYVEPALGLGSAEDVQDCGASTQRLFRYFPDDPRYSIFAVRSCLSAP